MLRAPADAFSLAWFEGVVMMRIASEQEHTGREVHFSSVRCELYSKISSYSPVVCRKAVEVFFLYLWGTCHPESGVLNNGL